MPGLLVTIQTEWATESKVCSTVLYCLEKRAEPPPISLISQSPVPSLLLSNSLLGLIAGGQREQDLGWAEELVLVSSHKQNKCENGIPSSWGLTFAFIAWCSTEASSENVLWRKRPVCRMAGLSALLSLTQPVFGLEGSHVAYEL